MPEQMSFAHKNMQLFSRFGQCSGAVASIFCF